MSTDTQITEPLTDTDYRRIYHLFDRAVTAEQKAIATGIPGIEPGLDDAIEIVTELYGLDALRQVPTGHSPRNDKPQDIAELRDASDEHRQLTTAQHI